MILILPSQALVLNAYAVLVGAKPGNAALKEHQAFIATTGVGEAGYKAALESFAAGSFTTASMATAMLANLGLSASFTQAQAEAFLAGNPGNRVGAMMDLAAQLYNYTGTDATLLAAKTAYQAKIADSYTYSNNAGNVNGQGFAGTGAQTYTLTTSLDNFVGTAGNDTFLARTINGGNTFQDGDMLDGGAGMDVVYLDFVSVGNAITPNLKSIESVVVRAQSASTDANGVDAVDGNNMPAARTIQIDAQRSLATDAANKVTADLGVTNWESSNSRSDVVIEDVRIGNTQKTKDITITFRESDPGNVDFGVYFDQHSLRNTGTGTTAINILLMDTAAAGTTATAATPLLNHNFNSYTFFVDNVKVVLGGAGTAAGTAIDAATTYPALLAAFQLALKTASVAGVVTDLSGGVTATLSGSVNMTTEAGKATESAAVAASFLNLTGQVLILSSAGTSAVASKSTAGEAGGWAAAGTAPSTGAIVQTFNTGATSTTELVTSKIVLDDVGRGSNGGDLVVGGMSVGDTSTSRGVERFEITVEDSSKLQTINSTNNALREVVIVNGTTSNVSSAYNTVVANAGDLTVISNITNKDTQLPGAENNSPAGNHDATGFTDVRLIDGSAMTGKLAFTAAISTDSLGKYVNLTDTASSPTADVANTGNTNFNVRGANFLYTGGANNDSMNVVIDSAVAASTTLTGQSDFTIVLNGGAGNDTITTNIGGNETAEWYVDQKANANITIEGGDGNDTITTTGAGAVIVNAGAGDDTVFADNSGTIGPKWVINAVGATPDLNNLQTNGLGGIVTAPSAATAFLYKGQVTVTFAGAGGAGAGGGVTSGVAAALTNGFEAKADIPTGANSAVTQFHINQAIKAAINGNSVLSKVLMAEDGPNNTLTVKSLIDGTFNNTDLKITVGSTYVASASEDTAIQTAWKAYTGDTAATLIAATNANTATAVAGNAVLGMNGVGVLGATSVTTPAVTESTVFTAQVLAAGATVVINGLTVTGVAGPGATAADVETALQTGVTTGGAVVTGAYTAGWTVDANAAGPALTVKYTSTTAGTDVVDLANTGTTAANALVKVADGAAAVTALTVSNGAISTAAESDNTINLGAGSDVVVLGTGATSNDKLVVTGYDQGKDTIVNFTIGGGAADTMTFKSYMVDKNVVGGVTNTIVPTVSADNDAAVVANDITIIRSASFTVTDTFAGLTAAKLLSAINTVGNVAYAGIVDGTLTALNGQSATQLVGGVGHAVVLIENDGNKGEYAAFELTFNGAQVGPATEFSAATLIGTFDFGNSITSAGLVGV